MLISKGLTLGFVEVHHLVELRNVIRVALHGSDHNPVGFRTGNLSRVNHGVDSPGYIRPHVDHLSTNSHHLVASPREEVEGVEDAFDSQP